ncbi:CcdB family protein [Thauera sp. 2A1]|uniref:CcdB family protein n=1 Tax=Thauera sp. 2A1 TaxID=2570191 RepID=UPI0012912498|nr:CcdB family protein [Thauera sp. 2A1]KAI5914876.1 CcdB family protein [Thauera sp. 2A1]
MIRRHRKFRREPGLLNHLNTRVVVPMLPRDDPLQPARGLNPVFEIDGRAWVMATQYVPAVPSSLLKAPVARLDAFRAEITTALDMLFQGF